MTLNELSRFYWARMNQAAYMEGAIKWHGWGDEQEMWNCLLNWAYYTDIADEIVDAHDFAEWLEIGDELRGYFV